MVANGTGRKAIALVLLVFALGVALGALAAYLSIGRSAGAKTANLRQQDRRARMVDQLTRELALTPEQQKQLDGILSDMQAKYQAIHEQARPQSEQVRQQGRDQIRAILTPEQGPKFEEFLRRIDEERKKKSSR